MAEELISASDVERYGYCPLSWYLERKGHNVPTRETREGVRRHAAVGRSARAVMRAETAAMESRRYIRIFTLLSVITAIQAFGYMIPVTTRWITGFVLMVIGIVWGMLAAYIFMFDRQAEKALDTVQLLTVAGIVVFLTGFINIVSYRYDRIVILSYEGSNFIPLILTLVWLLWAALYLNKLWTSIETAIALRKESRLPKGMIRYSDDLDGAMLHVSRTHGVSGRPDMIVERDGMMVPVEVKTGRVPQGPFFSHILQIAAYCLILEDTGERPPYGLIRYGDGAEFTVEYTEELKALVLEKVALMREHIATEVVHRNHHRPGKCRHCSRREGCPERLA
ncbi:MAG: PD-(D/E)XK nuclease family protein [Thermoplasmata archaeon]|nr:PD-(D/E)XK nuclease family protein [Thermoplasmata archaeon]